MRRVEVEAAARLHLGFLDLNGDLTRRFGSIGLRVDAFATRVALAPGEAFQALGAEPDRSARLARRIAEHLGVDLAKTLTVDEAIPAHAGLGSGTQLALAIAAAFRRFHALPPDAVADALCLERGARSGVGAALFECGGLVVDSGRGPRTDLPPIVSRLSFPEDWRVLLIMDPDSEGAHGEEERRAFARLPAFPAASAAEICRRALMQILPGVAERDFDLFGEGVTAIQAILGDHFAPAQGGGRFASAAVGRVAERLERFGARGVGQSSWGPTGFAFAADAEEAQRLAEGAADREHGVVVRICKALNRGAEARHAS